MQADRTGADFHAPFVFITVRAYIAFTVSTAGGFWIPTPLRGQKI